eukprot:632031-Amphidinium_carterae.1
MKGCPSTSAAMTVQAATPYPLQYLVSHPTSDRARYDHWSHCCLGLWVPVLKDQCVARCEGICMLR